MDELEQLEWAAIGERLKQLSADTFQDVVQRLREVVKAKETIARVDREMLQRAPQARLFSV